MSRRVIVPDVIFSTILFFAIEEPPKSVSCDPRRDAVRRDSVGEAYAGADEGVNSRLGDGSAALADARRAP